VCPSRRLHSRNCRFSFFYCTKQPEKKWNKSELSKKNVNQIRFIVFTRPSHYCSRRTNRRLAVFSFPHLFLVLFPKKDNLIDSIEVGRGADTASAPPMWPPLFHRWNWVLSTLPKWQGNIWRLLYSQGQRNANTRMRLDSIWVQLPKCEPLHQEWLSWSSDPVTYYADRLPTASKGYSLTMGYSMLVDVDSIIINEATNLNVKQTTYEIK
jgi:hypothetical protein